MPNILETEVSVKNVETAYVSFDEFVRRAEAAEAALNQLAGSKEFHSVNNLEDKANKINQQFKEIAAVRLDSGQLGNLTTEVIKAQERSRQLAKDITNIKAELANPTRSSSIKFLTEELKAAEREADQLARKLQTVDRNATEANKRRRTGSGTFGGHGRGVFGTGVPEMAVQRVLPADLDIALDLAQVVEASSIASLGAMAALGAGIAVLFATHKITKSIREEAEKRLKAEESIASAVTKQWREQQESKKQLAEQLKLIERRRELEGRLGGETDVGALERRKKALQDLLALDPTKENRERFEAEVVEIQQRIFQLQDTTRKKDLANFEQRNENFKKSQKNEEEFARKQIERINEQSKQLAELRQETEQLILTTEGKDNPLAKLMYEFETATERAQKRFSLLGKDYVQQIAEMEKKSIAQAIGKELFKTEQQVLRINQEIRRLANFNPNAVTKDDLQERLNRDIAEFQRTSNSTNPDAFNEFARRQKEIDTFDEKAAERERQERRKEIQELIDLARRGTISSADKNTEIVNATSGLSPAELGNELRQIRIDALRGQAQDLLNERKQAVETNRKISDFTDKFNKLISSKGFKVDVSDQAIVNLTVDGKQLSVEERKRLSQESAPSQADVNNTYEFSGFGIAGGSNR